MRLSDKQRHFTWMTAQLIKWAYQNGYGLTYGDAYRDPRLHGEYGVKGSYASASSEHKRRLAVDFNLFINGEYQQDTEAYEPLGVYWESIGGKWGGRLKRPDGNHFEYGG